MEDKKLDLDRDHHEVCQFLKVLESEQIKELGGALGIHYSNLKTMKELPSDMVAAWLRKEDDVLSKSSHPTWSTLVKCLREIGLNGTAKNITDHKLPAESTPSIVSGQGGPSPASDSQANDQAALQKTNVLSTGTQAEIQRLPTDEATPLIPNTSSTPNVDTEHTPNYPGENKDKEVPGISFPLLDVTTMSSDDKSLLEGRLTRESRAIWKKFYDMLDIFRQSLNEQKFPLNDLVSFLRRLKAYVSVKDIPPEQQESVFKEHMQQMKKATSIEDVFDVVEEYCSFFNYEIIEEMIERFGSENDKSELQKYTEELKQYAKRRIFECPSNFSKGKGGGTSLKLKLDSNYSKCSLNELGEFRIFLSVILKISPHTLLLRKVDDGCIELSFQIPAFIQHNSFPLSSSQEAALRDLGVLSLSSGDYYFSSEDHQSNEISRTDTKTEWSEEDIQQLLTEIPDTTFNTLLEEALKCDIEEFGSTFDDSSTPYNESDSTMNVIEQEVSAHSDIFSSTDFIHQTNQSESKKRSSTHSRDVHFPLPPLVRSSEEQRICAWSHYQSTESIVDYINRCRSEEGESPKELLSEDCINNYPHQLTLNTETVIKDKTMAYVDDLWRKCAKLFEVDPNSPVLKVVEDECNSFSITWMITDETADKIQEKIDLALRFFTKQSITKAVIDEKCVYDKEEMSERFVDACRGSNLEVVEALLKKGVDPNAELKESGWRGIHSAAKTGHTDLLEQLINAGVDLTAKTKIGKTALHFAAEGGQSSTVEILMKREGCVHVMNAQENEFADSALLLAVKYNHEDVVKILVGCKVDLNLVDKDGKTALRVAQEMGFTKIEGLLVPPGADKPPIKKGPQQGEKSKSTSTSFLQKIRKHILGIGMVLAARWGKFDTIRSVLEKGANVNYRENDPFQWTALMWASTDGRTELVKLLLENGADPTIKATIGGWNALILASKNSHYEVVKLLVDYMDVEGVNAQSSEGWTALMWAAQYRDYAGLRLSKDDEKRKTIQKIAECLLEKGADPNIAADNGWTPVMQASQDGHAEFIDLLSRTKCDPDHKAEKGMFALMAATLKNHSDVVDALARLGANMDLPNDKYQTALHIACFKGYEAAIQQLIQHGANMNAQDRLGLTPLMIAIKQKYVKIVENLIGAGADIQLEAEGYAKWTAITFATESGDKDIVRCVLSKNPDLFVKDTLGKGVLILAHHKKFVQLLSKHLKEKHHRFKDVDEEKIQQHVDRELQERKISFLDHQRYGKYELQYQILYRTAITFR